MDFEAELKKDYNFRLERRNEYLVKYKPMEDVVLFTEELLKQDYYYALLFNGMSYLFETRKEMDRYHTLLPEINKLYTKAYSRHAYTMLLMKQKDILLMGSLSEIKRILR